MVRKRGFLVNTGMPRLVLEESCATSIKDFTISPPHKKNTEYRIVVFSVVHYCQTNDNLDAILLAGYFLKFLSGLLNLFSILNSPFPDNVGILKHLKAMS